MPNAKYWTDSLNPMPGCTHVSEACDNCWAAAFAPRLKGMGIPAYQIPDPFEPRFIPARLDEVKHWRKPRVVAVNFMGDTFHPSHGGITLAKLYDAMAEAREHAFLVLTKRASIMAGYSYQFPTADNIWHGVTAENQARLDERLPHLLKVPGKRWLSLEPLLGGVNLGPNELLRWTGSEWERVIHQVVIGCESGLKRRPCKWSWVKSIIEQCDAAGVPVYVKQMPVPSKSHKMCWWSDYMLTLTPERADMVCGKVSTRVSRNPLEWPVWARRRELAFWPGKPEAWRED